jgi:hypothetical protein
MRGFIGLGGWGILEVNAEPMGQSRRMDGRPDVSQRGVDTGPFEPIEKGKAGELPCQ